ncbi:hypothetical protein BHM03_00014086 [Ensete ventricosum]|uniref:Uncharacterized protein n=1 Tax=Ensete ventricosum TaxID=4639 RepID=A0A445ME67_ENSVE|nr:hypothetical protein BHM03_00014086 [Ensete ventricosum]
MPSPVDAKSLRDLEVMKSYYDIASIITEESLRLIRERYSILEEYALRAPSPNQSSSTTRAASSSQEVEEIRVEAMPKRLAGSAAPEQAATTRPGKRVKITVKKHKSRHNEGSSQAVARGKELAALTEGDASPTYR